MRAYRQSPARNVIGPSEAMGSNRSNCKIGPFGRIGSCLQEMKWAQARASAAIFVIVELAHLGTSAGACEQRNGPKRGCGQQLLQC